MKNGYRGYHVGDRIKMIDCADPYAPIPAGEKGTIIYIDSMGTLHVNWDNGRTLGVCLEEDRVTSIAE